VFESKVPDKQQIFQLFRTTGWNQEYKLGPDQFFQAINTSWYQVAAYSDKTLVGYGRMISDGVVHALILDMIILPQCQGKGIGKAILKALVKRCREAEIHDIQLFCAEGKVEFYESCGFVRRGPEAPGMQIANYWHR